MVPEVRQRGFSLIEVLVAFMILAISLTVIFRIFSGGLRNIALSEDYARAVLVAESRMASAGVEAPLEAGTVSGRWDRRFRWRRAVELYRPWSDDKPLSVPIQAFRVSVSVDWEHFGRTRSVTLSGIRLQTPQVRGAPAL
jgi:general secretion pathway protein I